MIRRATLLALVAFLAIAASGAVAMAPPGPRLAIVAHDPCCGTDVITTGLAGELPQTMSGEPQPWNELVAADRPSWSADGNSLAFAVSRFKEDHGPIVAVARSDDGDRRPYPRAFLNSGDPVMAPDGASVAFARARLVKVLPGRENYLFKSSIWLLDVEDGTVRRVSRWRLESYLMPSSYSPDGSTLAMTVFDRRGARAVGLDIHSGKFKEIARRAWEPTYSPDGTRIAYVRRRAWEVRGSDPKPVTALMVGRVGSGGGKALLRRVGLIAWPSWDPSGSRLSFTRSPVDSPRSLSPLRGDKVMAINADGTCLTKVFSDPDLALHGSAWQPGVGREAGSIDCRAG
jgi:Tol biopolymer transport system component